MLHRYEKGAIILTDTDKITFTINQRRVLMRTIADNQIISETIIVKISGRNPKKYKLLDKSFGFSIFHCLYIALRQNQNLLNRLAAYSIKKMADENLPMEISLYEKI